MRHGHDQRDAQRARDDDRVLSATGALQAQAGAHLLRGASITHLRTSRLLRAQQTADHVGQVLGLPWQVDARLDEVGTGLHGQQMPQPPRLLRAADGADAWSRYVHAIGDLLHELTFANQGAGAHLWVCHSGTLDALFEAVTGTRGEVELAMAHGALTHWQYRPGARDGAWLLHSHNVSPQVVSTRAA